MRLANLRYIPQIRTSVVSSFRGINKCEDIADDEFVEARGVSLRNYPAICSRSKEGILYKNRIKNKRGAMEEIIIREVFYHEGNIFLLSHNKIFNGVKLIKYENELAEDSVKGSNIIANNNVNLSLFTVTLGSYICIFPIKQIYDTNTNKLLNMEVSHSETNVVFEPTFNGSTFTRIRIANASLFFRKYDAVNISGCINNDFNTTKIITEITNEYIVVVGKLLQAFTNGDRLVLTRKIPEIKHACEARNRLWACSDNGKEVYASKLGDPFNFNSFEGIATDSYAATIGSEGEFTACTSFLGHIYFFKENTIHKVFGDKPSNFQIIDYEAKGVKKGCEKSICIIDDVMYYAGVDGIYAYDGTIPVNISKQLGNISFSNVCAGEINGNYIFSILLEGAEGLREDIYIYYPRYKAFILYKSSSGFLTSQLAISKFVKVDNTLFRYNEKEIQEVYENIDNTQSFINDTRQSCLISKYMQEGTVMHKYITKLLFDIELGQNSTLVISLQYDDDKLWTEVFSTTSESHKTISVPILPRRCKKFRYKIDAIKDFILRAIVKFIEEGSEVDGFV